MKISFWSKGLVSVVAGLLFLTMVACSKLNDGGASFSTSTTGTVPVQEVSDNKKEAHEAKMKREASLDEEKSHGHNEDKEHDHKDEAKDHHSNIDDDKEHHDIKNADHYYIERPDLLPMAVQICSDWLARKGFSSN